MLLYDPLFDWTMNPLKALYLQQRPEDEADMSSTLGADPQECKRKARWKIYVFLLSVAVLYLFITKIACSGQDHT